MTRIHKMFLVAALTVVGVWGCSKAPTAMTGEQKQKQLEARVAKLESDLKEVVAGRDALRDRLTATEARLTDTAGQVKLWAAKAAGVERERDDLRAKLTAKTAERDQVQAQFDSFRKNIKELIGQAEGTAAAPAPDGQRPLVAGLRATGN